MRAAQYRRRCVCIGVYVRCTTRAPNTHACSPHQHHAPLQHYHDSKHSFLHHTQLPRLPTTTAASARRRLPQSTNAHAAPHPKLEPRAALPSGRGRGRARTHELERLPLHARVQPEERERESWKKSAPTDARERYSGNNLCANRPFPAVKLCANRGFRGRWTWVRAQFCPIIAISKPHFCNPPTSLPLYYLSRLPLSLATSWVPHPRFGCPLYGRQGQWRQEGGQRL